MMGLHAYAITQNRAAGVRAGGIHGDDAHRFLLLPIFTGKLVHQRTFARAGSARKSEYACTAA